MHPNMMPCKKTIFEFQAVVAVTIDHYRKRYFRRYTTNQAEAIFVGAIIVGTIINIYKNTKSCWNEIPKKINTLDKRKKKVNRHVDLAIAITAPCSNLRKVVPRKRRATIATAHSVLVSTNLCRYEKPSMKDGPSLSGNAPIDDLGIVTFTTTCSRSSSSSSQQLFLVLWL